MEIPSSRIWKGKEVDLVYRDIDHVGELEGRICMGVRVYCFHGDKLVITYSERKDMWEPAGGNVDEGEVSKIELIDPADYRKYFDWGIVGEHMIKRALEIKKGWRM